MCAYEQMFTLVDTSRWRNAVLNFSKYQNPTHHWHFRQQVLHAWKKPQSTDGALKWLHRNRMHIRERFNYLDVTFMTNVDRTEKQEKCAFFYCKCHVWKIPQVKEWTGDTNTFRLHLMGSCRRLKKSFYDGSSEGNFSNNLFLWIEGVSWSVWDRWQVVLSLAEIQSWKMIVGFLFQGTTTKSCIQSVKHK